MFVEMFLGKKEKRKEKSMYCLCKYSTVKRKRKKKKNTQKKNINIHCLYKCSKAEKEHALFVEMFQGEKEQTL